MIEKIKNFFRSPVNNAVIYVLLAGELLFSLSIIIAVPYTEIDWVAYMQEVGGFLKGEADYSKLAGDTGPLVYPAGFVYIYSFLYYITGEGTSIRIAQFIFAVIYVAFLYVVFTIYRRTESNGVLVLLLLCASRRIHSIFMLRLFNDVLAMLFMYISVIFAQKRHWKFSFLFFSVGVSVKMNVLLFLPGLLWLAFRDKGMGEVCIRVLEMVFLQIIVGCPFLVSYPRSYLTRAFNFGRSFFYEWTVNWRMFSEEFFGSAVLSGSLLLFHLVILLAFAHFKYCKRSGGVWKSFMKYFWKGGKSRVLLTPHYITAVLFSCNFIGIAVSRTLHYQFYVWYYHTLPFLLWISPFPVWLRIIVLLCTELVWNIFPPRAWCSWLLLACHLILLVGMWKSELWNRRRNVHKKEE